MSEPFIGQLQCFAFNFPPQGWAECNGQLLQISQNSALFSLLGTTYGGDGETTFQLPDLRGRVPQHNGAGPGLPNINIGQVGGAPATTLAIANIPSHTHAATLRASSENASETNPQNAALSVAREDTYRIGGTDRNMASGSVINSSTGGGQSFNNYTPYVALNWCIALVGLFPSQ